MRNDDRLELMLSDDPDVITDLWIHWKDDTALTVLKDVQSDPSRWGGVWYIPHMMTESILVTANVEDAKVRYFSVVERRVENTSSGVTCEDSEVECLLCGSPDGECGYSHGDSPFLDGDETESPQLWDESVKVIDAHLHDPLCPRLGIPAEQTPTPDEYCACGLITIVRRDERTKHESATPGSPSGNVDDHHDLCVCRTDPEGCEDCAPDYCSCECVTIERLENLGAVPRNFIRVDEKEDTERLDAEFHASLDDFMQYLTIEWGVARDWIDTVLTQGRSRLRQSALLVEIYAALNILHSGDLSKQWMTIPNTNPLFDGLSPMHYAMCRQGGLEDILALLRGRLGRDVVDAWVGP